MDLDVSTDFHQYGYYQKDVRGQAIHRSHLLAWSQGVRLGFWFFGARNQKPSLTPWLRVRLTEEKEAVIRQLHGEGKAVASIARTVGLTRKTIYRALARAGSKP